MNPLHRRAFLQASLSGLTAAASTPFAVAEDNSNPDAIAPPPRLAGTPSGLDTLFLTWQRDPTTTVTIQWIGPDVPADTTIRYSTPTGDKWRYAKPEPRLFPMTDWKVFRTELSGLTPGTEYLFKVGPSSRLFRFRTMPAKATDTFQFVSGGDSGVNAHALANNMVAAKQDPHFALLGGDVAYDNGRSPKTVVAFTQNYSRTMVDTKGRLIPLVAGIGNHEVNGSYGKTRKDAPHFFALFDGLYPETSYATLDFGDYLSLVMLDSGHVAPIGGDQADWLDGVLAARVERPHLFAVSHVPAYPSSRNPEASKSGAFGTGEANRLHWCPLFEKYNVDAVLEHHDHTFKRTHPLKDGRPDRYGVLYLGDGSWGQIRSPVPPEKRPYLAAASRSYHLSLHRLQGEQRFHIALEESGKIADVCVTTDKRPRKRG